MAQTDTVQLKLLIDVKNQKVIYAEADKKFIDFLFSLLTLPLGTVIRVLKNNSIVGSLANLYQSVENLNNTYMQPNQSKDNLLKPIMLIRSSCFPLLLPLINTPILPPPPLPPAPKPIIKRCCLECGRRTGDEVKVYCIRCDDYVKFTSTYKPSPSGSRNAAIGEEDDGGYVKGLVGYMVMDDLSVKPMSTVSSISVLNKFDIKEVDAVEEKVVTLDFNEGVKLLQASLQSRTVLTDVFLGSTMRETMQ